MVPSANPPGSPSACSVGSATVEINLGWIPLDNYLLPNDGWIANCPVEGSPTVRDCVVSILNYYQSQGASGLRFSFGMGGGACSRPFTTDAPGRLNPEWVSNLQTFLADVKASQYEYVSPNPSMGYIPAPWNGCPVDSPVTAVYLPSCQGMESLVFVPWLPYGFLVENYETKVDPDCKGQGEAGYTLAARHSSFWGWGPYFNLVKALLYAAKCAGLRISDFEIGSEVNLLDFPVSGRLIYDMDYSTDPPTLVADVYGTVRRLFDQIFGDQIPNAGGLVTYATTARYPHLENSTAWLADGLNCTSTVYSPPNGAMLILESELQSGMRGDWIGVPTGIDNTRNGLDCDGSVGAWMWEFIKDYSAQLPSTNSIYAYPCIKNPYYTGTGALCFVPTQDNLGPDGTTIPPCGDPPVQPCLGANYGSATTRNFFNDLKQFLSNWQIPNNKVVFSETARTQNPKASYHSGCWSELTTDASMAFSNVNGFNGYNGGSSTLFGSQVVFRPWMHLMGECYYMGPPPNGSAPIDPPYHHPQ